MQLVLYEAYLCFRSRYGCRLGLTLAKAAFCFGNLSLDFRLSVQTATLGTVASITPSILRFSPPCTTIVFIHIESQDAAL